MRICARPRLDELDGLPVDVGSGHGVPIREIAEHIANALDIQIAPEIKGEFRPGEMRHLTSDITRIELLVLSSRRSIFSPGSDALSPALDSAARNYVRDYFSEAARRLCAIKGIVHRVAETSKLCISVIIPALDEEEPIWDVVRSCLTTGLPNEVIVVDNGSNSLPSSVRKMLERG